MKLIFTITLCLCVINIYAQIGIGTTSPNSTLDVRGSISLNYRSFSSSTTATTTDNTLVFTGSTAATITLPDAGNCAGRMYAVKNSSSTLPTPVLTIATTSSQTIDGGTSWSLDEQNEMIELVSNGTNWNVTGSSPARTRSNYVLVKSATDFPAAVGGVITLDPTTLYEINGTISLSDKIDLNNSMIIGKDWYLDKLIYTPSSGELFTGSKGGDINRLTLTVANSGAKLFNLDAGGANLNLIVYECFVMGCNNIGIVKGFDGFVTFQTVMYIANTNGITYQNIKELYIHNTYWTSTNSNTYEKLIGTFEEIQITGGDRDALSANSAISLDVSGVTSIGSSAELKTVLFIGNGTKLNGIFSNKWEVESTGLTTEKDDIASGNLYVSTPVATTFSAPNTTTKVLGTTSSSALFRVTSPADNRLAYTGTKSKKFLVICAMSITSAGNSKTYSFYIYKNGVLVPESKQSRKIGTGADVGALAISCIIELSTNDYIELWVENSTDITTLTVQSMNLSIR